MSSLEMQRIKNDKIHAKKRNSDDVFCPVFSSVHRR